MDRLRLSPLLVVLASTAALAEPAHVAVLPAEGNATLAARLDAGLSVALLKAGRDVLSPAELAERLRANAEVSALVSTAEASLKRANQALLHLQRRRAIKGARAAIAALESSGARFHARQMLARAHGALARALMLKPADAPAAKASFTAALHADATFRPDPDRTPPRVLTRFEAAKRSMGPASAPTPEMLSKVAARVAVTRLVWVGVAEKDALARVEALVFDAHAQTGVGVRALGADKQRIVSEVSALLTKHLPQPARPAASLPVQPIAKKDTPSEQRAASLPTSRPIKTPKVIAQTSPWYKRWWVWAIVGTVAVASVGIAIGVTQSDSGNDGGYQFVFKY